MTTNRKGPPLRQVAICIPARDEVEELPGLFAALEQLDCRPFRQVHICLLLDGCGDASAAVASDYRARSIHRVHVETAPAAPANAGRARHSAALLGMAALSGDDGLLLTTDADTRPSPTWLAAMADALARADVVTGRIVRSGARPNELQDRIEAYYDALFALRRRLDPVPWEAGRTHHHSGGANMGFRASAYRALGGFRPLVSGEDARLIDEASRSGLRVRRDAASVVATSDRRHGRCPGGFADALRHGDESDAGSIRVAHPGDAAWQYRGHAIARSGFSGGRLDSVGQMIGLSHDHVIGVARDCTNAEAFAMRIVPVPPGRHARGRPPHRGDRACRAVACPGGGMIDPREAIAERTRALSSLADPEDAAALLELLRLLYAVGREDLPVGRLFEGHVDALQIVSRYGTERQGEAMRGVVAGGAAFGVWNADLPGEPLRLVAGRLSGGKSFASGAGLLSHALVTVDVEGGRQLILLDLARTPPAIDRSFWRVVGMQRSETHLVRWHGAAIAADELIGVPGDYAREPWFSGGALRFASVQAGGIAALVDRTRDHLVAAGRAADPHQAGRLAALYALAEAAAAAVRGAARGWFAGEAARLPLVAAARAAVYEAGDRALQLTQQAVGVQALFAAHPLADTITDLSVYLRQPAPDAQRMRVGAAVAAGTLSPGL